MRSWLYIVLAFCGLVAAPLLATVEVPASGLFYKTCTITAAAAGTPVVCLSDADVPAAMSAKLTHWHAKVNGGTLWGTVTSCVIEDTAGNDLVSMAAAALGANAFLVDGTANVTPASRYTLGSGGANDKGLQISCNANGTGSDLVVTVAGVIK